MDDHNPLDELRNRHAKARRISNMMMMKHTSHTNEELYSNIFNQHQRRFFLIFIIAIIFKNVSNTEPGNFFVQINLKKGFRGGKNHPPPL